ncbi:hypothetical protein ACFOEE_15160 [Pseudoalteromonas fenneropenaei]|uniref:Uncharacterized protein n=1 Tax=Pseudoalteromonas fenneropenaei TaxID=1737459 RepID=A0ABV7CMR3_9GAMM
MTTKDKLLAGVFVLLCCCVFLLAQYSTAQQANREAVARVEVRVALDLERTGVAQPFFKNAGDQYRLAQYIQHLNQRLVEQHALIEVVAIGTALQAKPEQYDYHATLRSAYDNVDIYFISRSPFVWHGLVLPVLLAFGVCLLGYRQQLKQVAVVEQVGQLATALQTKLVIDLYAKTLHLSGQPERVALANKPLCFYLAMLEYCAAHPGKVLSTNKELPEDFYELADKYFHRLVALGHTIRKRPNFGNSLEKTLSEIRAALDETFKSNPEMKTRFYPPKAHGEGSRSKLHSFSLELTALDEVEIHGK